MKSLLILSGKGGTGKTTVAGAFIKLAAAKAFADCDVDAPNLHLLMHDMGVPRKTDYFGMGKASIDFEKCIACGLCAEMCRFGAVHREGGIYKVETYACEGCAVCKMFCPSGAIEMAPTLAGEIDFYQAENAIFSTAELKMGSGTSGKLVTEVKKQLNEDAVSQVELAIVDGSPGIGCPVIASLSGVDMVLIVAEPSLSGVSDMKRIVETAGIFQVKIAVCVNKYDINPAHTEKIKEYCRNNELFFVGEIPFDSKAVTAVNNRQTIVDMDCVSGNAVREVFDATMKLFW